MTNSFSSLLVSAGCAYNPDTIWTEYTYEGEGGKTLPCEAENNRWWMRDSRGGTAGCPLQEDEWQQVTRCNGNTDCHVEVHSATVSLEYCCTSGDNPARVASGLKCFTLKGTCSSTPCTVAMTILRALYLQLCKCV